MSYNKNQRAGAGQSKVANTIAIVISIITVATIVLGLWLKNPYWIIIGIIPAAIYEAWRTEGTSTKAASIAIVALVILETMAIMGWVRFNLATMLGMKNYYLGGYLVPLGDIASIFPIAAVILSILLVRRTYGPYTKWLAILLIASSIALLYVVNKSIIPELLRQGASSSYRWLY